jgi:hypothetical protein
VSETIRDRADKNSDTDGRGNKRKQEDKSETEKQGSLRVTVPRKKKAKRLVDFKTAELEGLESFPFPIFNRQCSDAS